MTTEDQQTTAEIVEHMAAVRGYPDPDDAGEHYEADREAWWEAFEARELDDADFLARKRRLLRTLRNQRERALEAEIQQLQAWFKESTARYDDEIARCEARITEFHRRQIARNEKENKTIVLPSGVTLTSTAGRLSIEVDDADALVAWLEEHEAGDCIRYKPAEPDKKALVDRFGGKATTEPGDAPLVDEVTGEKIEGARVVRGDRSYDIK
jgi:hypothetical protein